MSFHFLHKSRRAASEADIPFFLLSLAFLLGSVFAYGMENGLISFQPMLVADAVILNKELFCFGCVFFVTTALLSAFSLLGFLILPIILLLFSTLYSIYIGFIISDSINNLSVIFCVTFIFSVFSTVFLSLLLSQRAYAGSRSVLKKLRADGTAFFSLLKAFPAVFTLALLLILAWLSASWLPEIL